MGMSMMHIAGIVIAIIAIVNITSMVMTFFSTFRCKHLHKFVLFMPFLSILTLAPQESSTQNTQRQVISLTKPIILENQIYSY